MPKEKLFEYSSYKSFLWKCKGLFHNLNRVSVWGKVHSAVKRNIPGIVAIPLPLADNHGMFPKTRSYAWGKGRICCLKQKQSLGVTAPCQENPSTEIRKAQVTSSDWFRGSFTSTKAINLVGLCYNSPICCLHRTQGQTTCEGVGQNKTVDSKNLNFHIVFLFMKYNFLNF